MKRCHSRVENRDVDIDRKEIVNALPKLSCNALKSHVMKIMNAYVDRKAFNVPGILACFVELNQI
jgi:hypothetical protein